MDDVHPRYTRQRRHTTSTIHLGPPWKSQDPHTGPMDRFWHTLPACLPGKRLFAPPSFPALPAFPLPSALAKRPSFPLAYPSCKLPSSRTITPAGENKLHVLNSPWSQICLVFHALMDPCAFWRTLGWPPFSYFIAGYCSVVRQGFCCGEGR